MTKGGLQKALFLESMHLMHLPGWELLEEGDVLAFKSPIPPFMDFAYGTPTAEAFQKLKEFYQQKPYFWLLTEDQNEQPLLEKGFTGPSLTFEMELDLAEYRPIPPTQDVLQVRSPEDHLQWIQVASQWLKIDLSRVDQFFTPWIQTGRYIPFLGFCKGQPAATSLLYCGQGGAALYALGTVPTFRNRGLGTAVTHACLQTAKDSKIARAVLYGSELGKSLYGKLGFQIVQTLREYASPQACK